MHKTATTKCTYSKKIIQGDSVKTTHGELIFLVSPVICRTIRNKNSLYFAYKLRTYTKDKEKYFLLTVLWFKSRIIDVTFHSCILSRRIVAKFSDRCIIPKRQAPANVL